MNLDDQLGALESGLDALIEANAEASAAPLVKPEERIQPAADEKPTLNVSRPEQNVISMTIAGKSVMLSAEGVSELIEQLSNARASMTVEQPVELPAGWRYVSTKNPAMATQKYPNGDRLLVMRHTGHGWVPFSFSPDKVIELYAALTKR